ncbi:MAG: UpxY family transcription antiterminator [Bacteroidales bacterium]
MNNIECLATQYNWFALYTTPRSEKKVAERLQTMEVECFLPMLHVQRKWSDRIKIVEVPLFNSYIFVKVKNHQLFELNKVYGVVKVVYYNGAPAIVRENEIEIIRKYIEAAGKCELVTGDEVEIISSSLSSENRLITGKIIRAKKNLLYLYVAQLNASVCVKKCEVKKV